MQFKIEDAVNNETLRQISVSIPNTLQANKIFVKDTDIEKLYGSNAEASLWEMWNQQHPLIHTWLLLSPISICFLFALLFIIH